MEIQIGDFIKVEGDEPVVEIDRKDKPVALEVLLPVEQVEPVDKVALEILPIEWTVEKVVAEKVRTIVMVVDDDEAGAVDDYIETVVIDETVDLMD